MSHNTLLEKIKADVAAEVAQVQEAGRVAVAAIERETEAQLRTMRAAHQAALDKKLAQLELVAISKAKQAGKLAEQTAKREAIDALFAAVETELTTLPAAEYEALFTQYATRIVPRDVVVVKVVAPQGRTTETEAVLKARGLQGAIEESAASKAGFMLYTKDGVYDVTLARIMSDARAELEMRVVAAVAA